jgi:hypothetical protein
MLWKREHLSTRELLLTVDRELPPRSLARARTHLAACAPCQFRMRDVERMIAETTRLYCDNTPASLPAAGGSRERLKMGMAELSQEARPSLPSRFSRWAVASALVLLAGLGVQLLIDRTAPDPSRAIGPESGVFLLPRADLTPGMTQRVTVSEVCGASRYGRTRPIPASVHEQVFQSYGADYRRSAEYELDHLITPELGGTQDARNLWPQPYSRTLWNAYVKDELELHFHGLVCEGKMDFSTAQHEIATDWISAYKRYFKTERPLRDYATSPLTERDTEFLLSELEELGLLYRPGDVQHRTVSHTFSAPALASFIAIADVAAGHEAKMPVPMVAVPRRIRRTPRNSQRISPAETASVPSGEPNDRVPEV